MMMEKTYTLEFKIQTVKLVTDGRASAAQLSNDLKIDLDTLYEWIREFSSKPEEIFPGNGHLTSDAEVIRQLKRDKKRLQVACEVLKKEADTSPGDPD